MAGHPIERTQRLIRALRSLALAGPCLAMTPAGPSLASTMVARGHDVTAGTDIDRIAGEIGEAPFRYGGSLEGRIEGHLVVGLQQPDANGHLQGEALLVTTAGARHTGSVGGTLREWTGPGGAPCRLEITFDAPTRADAIDLRGICTGTTLSGAISTRRKRAGWLARQIFWWDDSDPGGRYWLTRAGSMQASGTP